jgi:hypothetical protein
MRETRKAKKRRKKKKKKKERRKRKCTKRVIESSCLPIEPLTSHQAT